MEEKIFCAFTGHRPQSLPWKYDETAQECLLLKTTLTKEIEKLIDRNVTEFFSGLAQGVDIWAAQIVLALREKNPVLKLHCVLPCRDQAEKWDVLAQKCHRDILEQANSVICLSKSYHDGCMLDCINRIELATCTEKTRHSAGDFLPPRRRRLPGQKRPHTVRSTQEMCDFNTGGPENDGLPKDSHAAQQGM